MPRKLSSKNAFPAQAGIFGSQGHKIPAFAGKAVWGAILVLITSSPAFAAADCTAVREQILEMKIPEYASYTVWDAIYGGQDTQERFVSGLALASGNTLGAGVRNAKEDSVEIVLAEFDGRGRVVWEKAHAIPSLRAVKKIIAGKDGYILLAERAGAKGRSEIWLGFFDAAGDHKGTKTIRAEGSLSPEDIIPLAGKPGFMVSASQKQGASQDTNAVIYILNGKGDVVSHKSFMPGLDNRITSLAPADAGYYTAGGFIRSEDGRKNGWLLRIDDKAGIIWQRPYPRGRAAQVNTVMDYNDGYFVAAGESWPAGGGERAGWVLMADRDNGDIAWQRYYTGKMHYAAKGIMQNAGGALAVMLDAKNAPGKTGQEFVRLLTLDPRGVVQASDIYYNGEGADAGQLVPGNKGERILFGSTDMMYKNYAQAEGKEKTENPAPSKSSVDGWIAAATAMEPYKDPCAPVQAFQP
ncbi:MAG: hypothetical protein IT558_06490 [Alphaproteobacteria bacterium]|nr:hypothetical protein [Alphaproteobacteria bacterium]